MRAVRSNGESAQVVGNAADPVLAAGEALVHPTRLLVSAADAAMLRTRTSAAAGWTGVMGHQFVGVVKKINLSADAPPMLAARKGLLGRRVVGSPLIVCTNCDMCRAGLPGHCRARRVMGLSAREGCFADLFSIPLTSLVEVPSAVDDDRAVFAMLCASAVQAAKMVHASTKPFITVIGDSALALVTAQVLARHGKGTRLLYSRPDRARLCERWGLKARAIDEPGRRQDQDVVVECSGSPAGLRLAMQFVRPRGVILLKSPLAAAPFPPGQPFQGAEPGSRALDGVDLTPAIVNEVQILGCREATIADGLGVLTDGGIDVPSLISKRMKLDEAPAALALAEDPDQIAVMMDV